MPLLSSSITDHQSPPGLPGFLLTGFMIIWVHRHQMSKPWQHSVTINYIPGLTFCEVFLCYHHNRWLFDSEAISKLSFIILVVVHSLQL